MMSDVFVANAKDVQILSFIDLVIADWNTFPPQTGYTVENIPAIWEPLVAFGVQLFAVLFEQQRWTLMDFDYSDSGLSIRLDRVSKLDMAYKNLLDIYKGMILNAKMNVLAHTAAVGVGTPRYQSAIGQFLKIALGSAFNWNSP